MQRILSTDEPDSLKMSKKPEETVHVAGCTGGEQAHGMMCMKACAVKDRDLKTTGRHTHFLNATHNSPPHRNELGVGILLDPHPTLPGEQWGESPSPEPRPLKASVLQPTKWADEAPFILGSGNAPTKPRPASGHSGSPLTHGCTFQGLCPKNPLLVSKSPLLSFKHPAHGFLALYAPL